jgi:hypothetical protein
MRRKFFNFFGEAGIFESVNDLSRSERKGKPSFITPYLLPAVPAIDAYLSKIAKVNVPDDSRQASSLMPVTVK